MKMKALVGKAQKEIALDSKDRAMTLLKESIGNVKSARQTLVLAEKKHKQLLAKDIDEVLDERFVY